MPSDRPETYVRYAFAIGDIQTSESGLQRTKLLNDSVGYDFSAVYAELVQIYVIFKYTIFAATEISQHAVKSHARFRAQIRK